jgi:Rrf2 family protein
MLTAMTGYAATALGYLAERRGAPVRVPDIARERGIPRPFLAKIVRRLSAKGIVRTRRGVGGGVTLAVDPGRISLLDLCRMLDEPALQARCVLGQERCTEEHACPLHGAARAIHAQQLELLTRTSLLEIGQIDSARYGARRARRRRKA